MLVLATWRASAIVVNENGPAHIFARVRTRAGVYKPGEMSSLAELFSCVYCMSVWMGAAVLFLFYTVPLAVYALALSAGAIIVDHLVARARKS